MADNKFFEIHLKALSPISITKRNFGILSETYTFIPAWTMWNAFVKLYAVNNNIDYKSAQNNLKAIRLTNFYIMDENGKPLIKIPENERRKYISSDLKNAINPLTNTSLEGAIYEREYIYAKRFIGWARREESNTDLKIFFERLKGKIFFIGADKNTGFGKVKIEEVTIKLPEEKELQEALQSPKNEQYRLPVESEGNDFFPLVLRVWDEEKGSGGKIELVS